MPGSTGSSEINRDDNVTESKDHSESKSPRSVRRVAMDCLARREHSFFELKQKVQVKLPESEPLEIQEELKRLRDQNLQSDKRFTEAFVRYRKSKGFGFHHIREDLRSRFVAENLIGEYLFDDDDDWLRLINQHINKRCPSSETLKFGSKEHQRLVRFLTGRGFPSYLTKKVLSRRFQ